MEGLESAAERAETHARDIRPHLSVHVDHQGERAPGVRSAVGIPRRLQPGDVRIDERPYRFVSEVLRRIRAVEHARGPRHDLEPLALRHEERRDDRALPVRPVVLPRIVRVVLDGIGELPEPLLRAANERRARGILAVSRLEGPLPPDSAVDRRRARGAGPHLPDDPVALRDLDQAALGTHDPPVSVIDEAVRRHVAPEIRDALLARICFQVGREERDRPRVEVLLELLRPPARIGGRIRRPPLLAVILPPLPFEPLAPAGGYPELRLLEVDRERAGIDDAPELLVEVVGVCPARHHVEDVVPRGRHRVRGGTRPSRSARHRSAARRPTRRGRSPRRRPMKRRS